MDHSSTAFRAGTQVGTVIWAIGMLLLLSKQARRLKEPGHSRKGTWSATVAYLAILALNLQSVFQQAGLSGRWSGVAMTMATAAALLVALVLGIQALLEVRAARRAGAVIDAGGAGWGVGLAALMLVLMGAGVVAGLAGRGEVTAAADAATPLPTVRDEGLNYAYRPPPGVRALEAKKVVPVATLAFKQPGAEIFFVLIAEPAQLDVKELADMAEANLKSGAPDARVQERGAHAVNGLPGIRLQSRGQVKGMDITYLHWVHAARGYAYQLVTWGQTSDAAALRAAAEAFLAGFTVLDPDKVPAPPEVPADRRWSFRSPPWRYALELDKQAFSEWPGFAKELPAADFAARCGTGCGLQVIPLRLPDPAPGLDAVARALLDKVELEFPGDGYGERRPVALPPAEGLEVTYRQEGEKQSWDWRLRVLQAPPRAWLVAGWSLADDAEAAARRDAGVSAVRIEDGPAAEAPPAPSSEPERLRQARSLNEIGLHEYDTEQFALAAQHFAQASRLSPGDRALLGNAADSHGKAGLFAEGLELVAAGRKRFPGDQGLEASEAWLASRAGREAAALAAYGRLFARGFAEEKHLRRYVELLEEGGRRAEALSVLAAHRRRHDGVGPALLHARMLERAGQRPASLALLRAALARKADPWLGYELVDQLLAAGKKQEALAEATRLVKQLEGAAPLLEARGRAELALKRYEVAKGSFEAALEKDPGATDARRYLEEVSALLGEGENSSLKEPVEEVAIPAGLLEAAPAAAPTGHSAFFLERTAAVSFRKGKPLRRTDRWVGRALDAAGVDRLGTFNLSFSPLSERVFVNRVVVRDGAGKEVSRGKPGDWYVSDLARGDLGTHRRQLHVQVQGLRPGHEVEVVVSREEGGPAERMDFLEQTLAADLPRLRSALVVTGDVDQVATAATAGVEVRRAPGALALVATGTPVFRPEPYRADAQEWLPTAWTGPAGGDWATVAQAYEKDLAGVDHDDAEVGKVAAKEAGHLPSPEAKVAALARFVQKGLTYRAIEFGRRGRIPHQPGEVLRTRFGDCKDHALLLRRLLVAAGVPAHLALIRAGGPLRRELPSLDQFDHMVVYVPGPAGGTFIDMTDKGSSPGATTPGLGGRPALVLDGPRSRLVDLPPETPGRITTERVVALQGDALDVKESVRLEGPPAASLRVHLAETPSAERAEAIRSLLSSSSAGLRVTSVKVDGLEEVERPLRLELRYLVRDRIRRAGGELLLALPALWEREYLAAEPLEARVSPFDLTALEIRSAVEFTPPAGQGVAAPAAAEPGSGPFSRWSQRATVGAGGAVRLEATLSRSAGRHEAGRWSGLHEEMEHALAAVEPTLRVGKPR